MFMQTQKVKADQKFIGGHSQKWVWLVWSRDSEIDCISKTEQMEQTDFLHADTNSGKQKVDSIILGGPGQKWQWPFCS